MKTGSKILFLFLLFSGMENCNLWGQSLPAFPVKLISVYGYDKSNSQKEVAIFLCNRLNINQKRFGLSPVENNKSPSSGEKNFLILLDGLPIHKAMVHVQAGFGGKAIISIPDFNFDSPEVVGFPDFAQPLKENEEWVLLAQNGILKPFRKVENHQTLPRTISQTEFYDLDGNLKYLENWLLNFHESPDSIVKVAVFNPDPSTKLRRPYGDGIRDRNDSNSVLLTLALDTVLMTVQYASDTFELQNARFRMGEFSLPVRKMLRPDSDQFCFTRDSSFFEEVNVFYHLNRFRDYIDSLGFMNLANYQLKVDAHGMDGLDQSAYSPGLDVLAYGIGNVDDGEDAHVIVHEYGHVLSNSARPFGNSGMERKSVEEGICDYLAGSYARQLNDWEWQKLFKWDGWNEFWPGRSVLSTKHYPENLIGQIHRDGEIFSSALMNIELLIGRDLTHRILISTLPALVPDLTMPQAAHLFLETDSMLFGGAHSIAIKAVFDSKGISNGSIIVSIPANENQKIENQWIKLIGKNEFQLQASSLRRSSIELVDLNGRILKKISPGIFENGPFHLEGLTPGLYYLIGRSDQKTERLKFAFQP